MVRSFSRRCRESLISSKERPRCPISSWPPTSAGTLRSPAAISLAAVARRVRGREYCQAAPSTSRVPMAARAMESSTLGRASSSPRRSTTSDGISMTTCQG